MMRKFVVYLTLIVLASGTSLSPLSPTESQTADKPTIFVPAGATLLTELQLTKDDLLPVVAQVFSYFSLQHSGGQFIQGEQLRSLITSMEALWLVEYDYKQKGATPADLVQMNRSLLEAQGWRRIFWNRSGDGNRETVVMVEPPRKGLFVLTARLNSGSGNIRVVAIRTQGEIDVGTTLWLLTTFLMRPEAPTPSATPAPPLSTEEKTPPVKPAPETPQKQPEQGGQQSQDKSKSDNSGGGEKGDKPVTGEGK